MRQNSHGGERLRRCSFLASSSLCVYCCCRKRGRGISFKFLSDQSSKRKLILKEFSWLRDTVCGVHQVSRLKSLASAPPTLRQQLGQRLSYAMNTCNSPVLTRTGDAVVPGRKCVRYLLHPALFCRLTPPEPSPGSMFLY